MCFPPSTVPGTPGRLGEHTATEDLTCGCVGARAENLFLDINRALGIRKCFPA